ncbi:MAG: nuclear transport factor 2 family protein [Rhizobiales bacterium]|nr:nuclear transport factor 2 family protein [Hyphomicrobiales bacterium]
MRPHLPADLPQPIAGFIAARNRRDYDDAVAAFSPAATVSDEGGIHRGRAAIRTWMEETVAKYDDTAEIVAAIPDDGAWLVTARVTGRFPGSPAMLRFAFTLDADGVARLEVGS